MGNKLSRSPWCEVTVAVAAVIDSVDSRKRKLDDNVSDRSPNRKRDRIFAPEEIDFLSEYDFAKLFRMKRSSFNKLLEAISPFLHSTDEEMARRSSGTNISKKTKLYCTLRWLAGGSYLDICLTFGVSKGSLFSSDPRKGIIWPIIDAINVAFQIGLPIHDVDEMKKTAEGFGRYTNNELIGCISAIDGWVCKTRKPTQAEVGDVMAYRNRHGCWGLVVLAGCDVNCKFNIFSCKNSGSTNDCLAWDICAAKDIVEGPAWPDEYYVIGDEAFVCTNNFLVPYSGRGIGVAKDSFNYMLSRMRQCIERAFALLVQRWGILWRPLCSEFPRWTKLLMCCAKLHNFCIDESDAPIRARYINDIQPNDTCDLVMNQYHVDSDELQFISTSNHGRLKRNRLCYILQSKGIVRPTHNMNSRA